MEEWEPIAKRSVDVTGVDPQHPGLLLAWVRLDRRPPKEWAATFEHPPDVGISVSMHAPQLSGNSVLIRPPDDELEKYVSHVVDRIEACNRLYLSNVWPKLVAARKKAADQEAEQKRRVEEAKRRASEL